MKTENELSENWLRDKVNEIKELREAEKERSLKETNEIHCLKVENHDLTKSIEELKEQLEESQENLRAWSESAKELDRLKSENEQLKEAIFINFMYVNL